VRTQRQRGGESTATTRGMDGKEEEGIKEVVVGVEEEEEEEEEEEGFEEEAPGVIDEEERRIDDGKEGESTRYANRMRTTDTMRVRWVIPEQQL